VASPRVRPLLGYVGANIRKARDKAGLTQESLAEAADLDVRFLQRLEHGKTNVSVEAA
jgi:transcriptional regulator with XRE-family HTH domain